MKSKFFLCTAALVLGAAPLLAQAALMDITVTGTVYNSYDKIGNIFGYGTGNGVINGQTAALRFTYDTANALGDYYNGAYPYSAYYLHSGDWIEFSASVGGHAVSTGVVNGNNNTYGYSYVTLDDYLPNWIYNYDRIAAGIVYFSEDYVIVNNGNYSHRQENSNNYFYFYSFEDFLNSVALNQTFSETVDSNHNGGFGFALISQDVGGYECLNMDCSASQYVRYKSGYALINLNTVTMSPRNAAIPEPGSLALLGLGLSGLAFVRRRKAVAC